MKYVQILLLMIASGSVLAKALHFEGQIYEPFISKWAFYEICDLGYDPLTHARQYPLDKKKAVTFNPEEVLKGDIIFIRGRSIPRFFQTIAPLIKVPYCIVTHGEYLDAFTEAYSTYLNDPLVIAWFGTHPIAVKHTKFYPIPLGVHPSYKGDPSIFSELRLKEKTGLVYANFSEKTHPDRALLLKYMKDTSYCYCAERCPYVDYLSQMASYKFTLSPRGLGIDCYRTWEALLVGSIPIVKSSYLDSLYDGLPVLIIKDWESITEEFLHTQYQKIISKTYRLDKLYLDYWLSLINELKNSSLKKKEPEPLSLFQRLKNLLS